MDTLEVFTDLDIAGVATRLQQAREAAGLSRAGVSSLADIDPTHYARLEQGRGGHMRLDTLYKLCMVLRVSADWLLGLPEAPPPAS